jgi:endonuclease-3
MDAVMRRLRARYRGQPGASQQPTPWECLLFTMLSARSRDDRTEIAFRALVGAYPTIPALAAAAPKDIEPFLKTIGLWREKAANAVALARALVERHGGQVPADMDALTALPGVGRKTASCVLVYAYGIPAIAVDTHVHRIANRLGWVKAASPASTEQQLRKVLPKRFWLDVNRVMIFFGREICVPGRPKCGACPVAEWCAYPHKTPPARPSARRLSK